MLEIDLTLDVTAQAGFGQKQQVTGTVFLPDSLRTGRPIVLFAMPGGGYSRFYFHMQFPGLHGYSEAEYHTARRLIFVAIDHVGVGDSSTDRLDDITVEVMSDCNTAFVKAVLHRLADATLDPRLLPVVDPFVVGMGQSMGAGVTMVMQGRHALFHAIAPLGISAIHTCLPQPTAEQFKAARDAFMFSRLTPLDQLEVRSTSSHIADFRYPFHWEDEPREIQDADLRGGYPLRRTAPKFGSLTVPRCAVAMMSAGYFTPEASRISVPVLMGYGERDTSADMRREATAFFSSNDISVFIVPRMAHMHNFANTRQTLWQRVADWAEMQCRAYESSTV